MMPVVVRQLATSMLQVLRSLEKSEAKNARKWADAYNKYAQPAAAGVAIPQFIGTEASKMVPMLQTVMKAPSPNSSAFAVALASAMEAFWLLPPVPFIPPGGAGAVTSFPGKPALIIGLTGVLSAPQSEVAAAEAIAGQLDVATKTVLETFAIPPAPPVIAPIF